MTTAAPTAAITAAIFDVPLAPLDPILGLNEQFAANSNPKKVNLGVGVYYDGAGKLPLLACVRQAEAAIAAQPSAHGYLPIDGVPAYVHEVKALVFGADSAVLQEGRVAAVQAVGGTGGLKIGADFLHARAPEAAVYISDPSWENHRALFANAGFTVENYPYYDSDKRGVNLAAMLACIAAAPSGSIFVLHACCHNPTGYDLQPEQWEAVIAALKASDHIAFLDMAYQGFSQGLTQDGALVQRCVAAGLAFFVASSFSKSFGLYGERVGALSVVCHSADEARRVLSQLKVVIRTNYSNPAAHGAKVVVKVLSTPALRQQWEDELGVMRDRIRTMRSQLVTRLQAAGVQPDMSFIVQQSGMFSYTGLSKPQMERLRSEFGVYGTDAGRICVAALNDGNIDYVCNSIAAVLSASS